MDETVGNKYTKVTILCT